MTWTLKLYIVSSCAFRSGLLCGVLLEFSIQILGSPHFWLKSAVLTMLLPAYYVGSFFDSLTLLIFVLWKGRRYVWYVDSSSISFLSVDMKRQKNIFDKCIRLLLTNLGGYSTTLILISWALIGMAYAASLTTCIFTFPHGGNIGSSTYIAHRTPP